MANLINIGLSGLKASQAALNTTSNNISNSDTEGYNRQIANLKQLPGSSSAEGYFGNGVNVQSIARQYEGYISTQLNEAKSEQGAFNTQLTQMSQIDNVLANDESGLSTMMANFFSSMQSLSNTPTDPAVRETLLGNVQSMVAQFNSVSNYLGDMETGVESQLDDAVSQINSYTSQIANLNKQITLTSARTGEAPNDLMDQRDLFVSKLSELTSVDVIEQNGKYNVSLPTGQSLVLGEKSYSMAVVDSDEDPTQKTLALVNSSGNSVQLNESRLDGGVVGGLLGFRNEGLADAQERLGQIAVALAGSLNEQHQEGFDLNGDAGKALFTFDEPSSYANANNDGAATVSTTFDGNYSDVRASNYTVDYNGGDYTVTRESDNSTTTFSAASLPTDANGDSVINVDGLDIAISGTPADGDSFVVKPTENAGRSLTLALSDTAELAAAGTTGSLGDNTNAQAMADLQGGLTVGGTTSFSGAYAQLVSNAGTETAALKVKSSAQDSVVNQISTAQQSVSGVNLEEEAANLLKYQQLYTANAKVIGTAQNLFNTLIGIMG